MIRVLLAVVTVAAAALVTAHAGAVDDPTDPAGLAPVETLTPPPRFKFKNTKIDRPLEVGAASDDEAAEMLEEQNLMMRMYLSYFDDLRKKRADQYSRDNMDVIKLLMAHGWLYLMKPKKDDIKGIIPVDERRTLEDLRNDLVVEIKDRDRVTPVENALLWYSNGLQKQMKTDAEKDINRYNKMLVSRKIIQKITDADMKARLVNENKENNLLLEKSRIYREFNEVTFKMCLMSYIIIFREQPFTADKFTMTSSDGRQKKVFVTPPLGRDKFEQLFVTAEMELDGEESTDPGTETESFTLKEYRAEQSLIISKYLKEFEKMRLQLPSFEDRNVYKIIKLLIVRSWLYMLKPDTSLLENIITVAPGKSTEDVKIDVSLELKKTMAKNDIEDAINDYAKSIHGKIKDTFEKQAETLILKVDNNIEQIGRMNPGLLRERKIAEKNDNLLKLEETRLNLQIHELTTNMCLQTYALIFLSSPYPATITIKPTHDPVRDFDLPPLGADSYEALYSQFLVNSSEEDEY